MPKMPRETADPIGQKLLQMLSEKGRPDDLNFLADAFGVRVQSVYDWINHGRIAKDRYARLVEWSGRSLHWWFDLPEIVSSAGSSPLGPSPAINEVREPESPWPGPQWPFRRVSYESITRLSPEDLAFLEGVMTGAIASVPSTPNQTKRQAA